MYHVNRGRVWSGSECYGKNAILIGDKKVVAQRKHDDRYEDMDPRDDDINEQGEAELHGMPMTLEAFEQVLTVESPYRYEWIDGVIYYMAPPSKAHALIASHIDRALSDQIGDDGPCRVFREQSVLFPGRAYITPDVVLTCDLADCDKDKLFESSPIQSPLLVIEILSPSTRRFDRTEKFERYKCCPSLEVYILVTQKKRQV